MDQVSDNELLELPYEIWYLRGEMSRPKLLHHVGDNHS